MTRKLRSELKSLRQQASVEASDDELLRLLVELVARRDAIFFPWRPIGHQAVGDFPAILEAQANYLDGVCGVQARAAGRDTWKDLHFLRRKLIDAGFARPVKKSGQVTSLIITETGHATAWQIVDGSPSMPDTALLIYELLQRKPYQSESHLFARELYGDPAEWLELTELVMPLLVRGVVAQSVDTVGRLFYYPTARELPGLSRRKKRSGRGHSMPTAKRMQRNGGRYRTCDMTVLPYSSRYQQHRLGTRYRALTSAKSIRPASIWRYFVPRNKGVKTMQKPFKKSRFEDALANRLLPGRDYQRCANEIGVSLWVAYTISRSDQFREKVSAIRAEACL